MLLYINGDEISAGACCVNDYVIASDDELIHMQGNKGHPDNIIHSYGYYFSRLMNLGLRCEASQKENNLEIAEQVENFIFNLLPKLKSNYTFAVVGWKTIIDPDPVVRTAELLKQHNVDYIFFNENKPAANGMKINIDNLIDLSDPTMCINNWLKAHNQILKNGKYPDPQGHNAWAKQLFNLVIDSQENG